MRRQPTSLQLLKTPLNNGPEGIRTHGIAARGQNEESRKADMIRKEIMKHVFFKAYGPVYPKMNCSQALFRTLLANSELVQGVHPSAFTGIAVTVDRFFPMIQEDGTLLHGFMYDGERVILLADAPMVPFTTA
jgi:hypothetical protein